MGGTRNACRGLEGVAMVGNAKEGASEYTVGAFGEISTADIRGRDLTGRARMVDNGPQT